MDDLLKLSEIDITIEQWLIVLKKEGRHSEIGQFAMKKVLEKAETFEHWHDVHYEGYGDDRDSSSTMMWKTAKTFDNWFLLCGWGNDVELNKLAFAKALEESRSFGQKFAIYNHRLVDEDTKRIVFTQIMEMEISFEQWQEINRHSTDPEQKNFIIKMMFEKAETFDHWCTVCAKSNIDSEIHKLAITMLLEMKYITLKQWYHAFRDYNNPELSEMAFTIISEKKSIGFYEWLELYEYQNTKRIKNLVHAKILEFNTPFDEWLRLCKKRSDNNFCEIVIEVLSGMDIKFQQWFMIHEIASDYALREPTFIKMTETAETFSDWDKLRKMSNPEGKVYKRSQIKMSETAETFDDWYLLLSWNFPREIQELARKTLSEMSLTKRQWQKLLDLEKI